MLAKLDHVDRLVLHSDGSTQYTDREKPVLRSVASRQNVWATGRTPGIQPDQLSSLTPSKCIAAAAHFNKDGAQLQGIVRDRLGERLK